MLDLKNNRILDENAIEEVFAKMTSLRVLYLNGNPIKTKTVCYRKRLIFECKELTFLDDETMAPNERRLVTAFMKGGYEAEREEKVLIRTEKRAKRAERLKITMAMSEKIKRNRTQ